MQEHKDRCFGNGIGKEFYAKYHDDEWGVPVHDDRHLFEMLILEGAQAGLSWELILKRREGYRNVFHNFEPSIIDKMSDEALEALTDCPEIIRNRRKIFSVRQNAKVFLEVQREFGSFDSYLWKFVGGKPIVNHWKALSEVPCLSKESELISKDLKKRGMIFVGPKIIYSYMQAVGLINDHIDTCWRRRYCDTAKC